MGSHGACVSYWDVGGCSFTEMIMTTSVTGMRRSKCSNNNIVTLWLFNIAMEHSP